MANKTRAVQFTITVSGTTGSEQTGRPIMGELRAVHLEYSDSMAATCDVTITRKADGAMPSETLLTVSNNATDNWYRPRAGLVDKLNDALINVFDNFSISGYVGGSIAHGTDGETVTVTLLYEAAQ